MCRRNQLLGVAISAFGLGLLVAGLFSSTFLCGCVGFIGIIGGVVVIQKK